MQYYGLKSIVASQKQSIDIKIESDSFYLSRERVTPYIEPTFSKEDFPSEKPAILLINAVGASGKTTTALALAHDTQLPILDLAKHNPIGDNTLTGILTNSYPIEKIQQVLEGIAKGTHGIIVDGIDEGRSKTTEQGFEAFLDDLYKRSKGADSTVIVIFGRSQALIHSWAYLGDKGADVGLISVDPFNLVQAKDYIDAYVMDRKPDHQLTYEQARDDILTKLGAAFTSSHDQDDAFLSFVGYPPVLDSIATLLTEEQNYHNVCQKLGDDPGSNLEVQLLIRIANFLLDREQTEKARPNFIDKIADQADGNMSAHLKMSLYNHEEQCARILYRAIKLKLQKQIISDSMLNDQYETALETWCDEHPFLCDGQIRNPVFGAIAVAKCALSSAIEYQDIAYKYTQQKQPTYHLLYMMAELAKEQKIEAKFINMLMQSSSEFIGLPGLVEVDIDGYSSEETDVPDMTTAEVEFRVRLPLIRQERSFNFEAIIHKDNVILFGPYILAAKIVVPCGVKLYAPLAVENIGVTTISASEAFFDTPNIIISPHAKSNEEHLLSLDVNQAQGHTETVSNSGGKMEIMCSAHELGYPLAKYVTKKEKVAQNGDIQEEYRRLRRILVLFRSHSKGEMAKFKDKIEHERVLQGTIGEKVLQKLVDEQILRVDGHMYKINQEIFQEKLGVSWIDLRHYKSSNQLDAFLKRVS